MVLAIVGLKMLLAEPLKDALGPAFNIYLLLVVLVVLAFGVVASLWTDQRSSGRHWCRRRPLRERSRRLPEMATGTAMWFELEL